MMIGAILLAAGRGTRAGGGNKLLVRDPEGVAMVSRTAAALRASAVGSVLLVLGHQAEAVRAAVEETCPGLPTLLATGHAEGMAAGVRQGIEAATQAGWDAAIICLADMPHVGRALIDRLIDAHRDALPRPGAVLPLAAGRRGNPVLWDRRLFPSLLGVRGDRGGRDLLAGASTRVLAVETGDRAILVDYDTPEQLARFAGGDV